MDAPTPGTVIAERYRLTRPLGSGSSAVVWEAQDSSLDRLVAVKLLHGGAAAHPAGREQLRREALALARLSHPRVTTVFDYIEWQDGDGDFQPVLVTELLAGLNLEDRLEQGPLLENDARLACAQLASALEAVHQVGIIHRDLKPGNVMLMSDGVKLLDFGIAQASSDTDARTGLVIGTPSCMAPEQLTGPRRAAGLRRLRAGLHPLLVRDRPRAVRGRDDRRRGQGPPAQAPAAAADRRACRRR